MSWEPLGSLPPRGLAEARILLHHAAQLLAAVGRSLVPPRPDDGHTSFEWRAGAFVGQEVPGSPPWQVALRPSDLSLAVVTDGADAERLALAGRTQDEALAWLAAAARARGTAARLTLAAPYALPGHAVASGAAFPSGDAGSFAELGRWFADGDALLRAVAGAWPGAAPVRVWPHHFDVGSVLPLGGGSGEEAPSIGVGLSPGDDGIAEPYLYVTLWPALTAGALPALPAGRWHREGWLGALLTGSEIVAAGDGSAQAALAGAFASGAVDVLRAAHAGRS
ncbi:MAG: hypothetical protein AB7O37_10275 [Vicinamibacteria bacterium]